MKPDPAIEDIRRVRHQISAKFNHDPHRLVEHYIELQKRHETRIVPGFQITDGAGAAKVTIDE